jgi:undecaprenyl-diphosphatase
VSLFQAILLGLLQGLTEFLPVSSSGHLAILQNLWGLGEMLAFDVALHVATLLAVLIYFRREVWALVRGFVFVCRSVTPAGRPFPGTPEHDDRRLFLYVFFASIPTAAIALSLHKVIKAAEKDLVAVGVFLVITGILLFVTRRFTGLGRDFARMTARDSLIVGVVQGVAALPGISRSGSTISAGIYVGLERRLAARFSFLIFIPAMVGAAILEAKDITAGAVGSPWLLIAGMAVAFVSGYAAITVVFRVLEKRRFAWFAPYCWAVGVAAVVLGLVKAFK